MSPPLHELVSKPHEYTDSHITKDIRLAVGGFVVVVEALTKKRGRNMGSL